MKKIIFFLLTTEKYTDRQDNILSNWGKNLELYFYSEHHDQNRNVLKVCDQNSVSTKQISIFKEIQKNFYNKSEWYFFGDDDTFVNVKKLLQDIDNFDKSKVHGQDLGLHKCWGDLNYPSGGAGFLIHNQIIHNFFESRNYGIDISDVTFGLNMKDMNIEIEDNPKFLSQHPSFYKINITDCNQYYTFHYVKNADESKLMDEICQN